MPGQFRTTGDVSGLVDRYPKKTPRTAAFRAGRPGQRTEPVGPSGSRLAPDYQGTAAFAHVIKQVVDDPQFRLAADKHCVVQAPTPTLRLQSTQTTLLPATATIQPTTTWRHRSADARRMSPL